MSHILLVLSDKVLSDRITELLEYKGHIVDQFYSFESAQNKYKHMNKKTRYSIVIIDQILLKTDNDNFPDQANSLNLVKKILGLKIIDKTTEQVKKNRYPFSFIFSFHNLSIILLSSHPTPISNVTDFFNLKKIKPVKKQKKSPIHIIHKGREMEDMLKSKIDELNYRYRKRKYNFLKIGFIFPTISGIFIIFQNIMKQITFLSVFYSIVIIVILLVFYYLRIRPKNPLRVKFAYKANKLKEQK